MRRFTILAAIGVVCGWQPASALQCPDGAPPPCQGVRPPPPVVIILPFENRSTDSSDRFVATTLRDELVSELGATRSVRVLDRAGRPAAGSFTVDGSVSRAGTALAFRVRLLRTRSAEVIWSVRLDRRTIDPDLPWAISRGILEALGLPAVRGRARPVNQAAYEAFLAGQYYRPRRTEAAATRAIAAFEQAIALDSGFAAAWSGLANAWISAHAWGFAASQENALARALEASERATRLDSNDANIWFTRAIVARALDPTSRSAVLRATRNAIRADSNHAGAWQHLGSVWNDLGRPDSAIGPLRRATALEPLSAILLAIRSQHHYWTREFDSAAAYGDSAVSVDPALPYGHETAGFAALAQGRAAAARGHFQASRRLASGTEVVRSLEGLALVAAFTGDTATAGGLAVEAERAAAGTRLPPHTALSIAGAWLAAGDTARALTWLERYDPRGDLHFQLHLNRDVVFDVLRGVPRFERLLVAVRM